MTDDAPRLLCSVQLMDVTDVTDVVEWERIRPSLARAKRQTLDRDVTRRQVAPSLVPWSGTSRRRAQKSGTAAAAPPAYRLRECQACPSFFPGLHPDTNADTDTIPPLAPRSPAPCPPNAPTMAMPPGPSRSKRKASRSAPPTCPTAPTGARVRLTSTNAPAHAHTNSPQSRKSKRRSSTRPSSRSSMQSSRRAKKPQRLPRANPSTTARVTLTTTMPPPTPSPSLVSSRTQIE
jgi:hypothetical protein